MSSMRTQLKQIIGMVYAKIAKRKLIKKINNLQHEQSEF
ncbi:hypothetical protein CUO_2746 [Enterococcus faecium PC4.1]|nr:hypothetical protein CUO_2746 [Enterococcus faecium PC4.1]